MDKIFSILSARTFSFRVLLYYVELYLKLTQNQY